MHAVRPVFGRCRETEAVEPRIDKVQSCIEAKKTFRHGHAKDMEVCYAAELLREIEERFERIIFGLAEIVPQIIALLDLYSFKDAA